jgi:hypothetical protein|tara:strand:+ start:795 stop:1763 length:969 start_codon:yes stop_codon:yes gene_type:complete
MSNDLVQPFDLSKAPKHIGSEQTELARSLITTQSINIPRISINGKGGWEIKLGSVVQSGGEAKYLDVVIVGVAPKVSRLFYEDEYGSDAVKPPVCWSNDSEKPSSAIKNPQALACSGCPRNIKGAGGKKCRFHRRLAVVRAEKIDGEIYQMQLSSTSIFPKTDGTKMAFNGYLNYLAVNNTSIDRVITRMYFDDEVAWGKLFFSAVQFVDEGDVSTLDKLTNAAEVQEAITTSYSLVDNDVESKTAFVEQKTTESNGASEPIGIFETTDASIGSEVIKEPAEKPKVKTRKKKEVAPKESTNEELQNIIDQFSTDNKDSEVDD